MGWQQIASVLEKVVPVALIAGLLADWVRLRITHRSEERKHIARAISDLLQLRYIVRILPEFPKLASELIPKELKSQVPPDIWHFIDFGKVVPMDEELPKRYRKAVEEIAGFRPVLAFQLRDKERYFDLRNFLSQHLSQSPGSPLVANRVTEVLDRETVPILEETLSVLAKAHSIHMWLSIKLALRRRHVAGDMIPPEIRRVFHEQILQLVKAASSQAREKPAGPGQATSDHSP